MPDQSVRLSVDDAKSIISDQTTLYDHLQSQVLALTRSLLALVAIIVAIVSILVSNSSPSGAYESVFGYSDTITEIASSTPDPFFIAYSLLYLTSMLSVLHLFSGVLTFVKSVYNSIKLLSAPRLYPHLVTEQSIKIVQKSNNTAAYELWIRKNQQELSRLTNKLDNVYQQTRHSVRDLIFGVIFLLLSQTIVGYILISIITLCILTASVHIGYPVIRSKLVDREIVEDFRRKIEKHPTLLLLCEQTHLYLHGFKMWWININKKHEMTPVTLLPFIVYLIYILIWVRWG